MKSEKGTKQLKSWISDLGREYTDRNLMSAEETDRELERYYGGVKKSDVFRQFLSPERVQSGRVLEVGCNVGVQLEILRIANEGLESYGVEPMAYALAKARELRPDMHFLPGSASDLPFKNDYFDVVMTNGVLIHISPDDIPDAVAEICRCSKRFIFLHEYFSDEPVEVRYRSASALLWKMDYMKSYLTLLPNLRCVEVRYLHYPDPEDGSELVDQICLLEKANGDLGNEGC